jgi:hypothetical protein
VVRRYRIDCAASRTVAPWLIVERGGQSVFARQPETAEELIMAWRAPALSHGFGSHRGTSMRPAWVFPQEMAEGIFRLGYNARF